MCNAIDEQGYQTHIMSTIGHQTKNWDTEIQSYIHRRTERQLTPNVRLVFDYLRMTRDSHPMQTLEREKIYRGFEPKTSLPA